ncbi:MAG TPA: GTP 3',8-cyclase MoaA [candidate division Zixibacteria bacterium]|nr:GTP 3',8-cyclase MoaA [candidate division Zixibacteria bacterium]
MLVDSFGRSIDYLRISLTDRCNFRCVYCFPPTGVKLAPRSELLSWQEILRIARVAVDLRITKIKLTGGEPLVFKEIVKLVGKLSALPGLADLSLTTNGSLLGHLGQPLYAAGLRRLNLSLDSLNPERFARISRGGSLAEVLSGFESANKLGFKIKINTVLLKDWNTDELFDLIAFAQENGVEIRFIEFMPLCGQGWNGNFFMGVRDVQARLRERYELHPLESSGVAQRFATHTGARIGFIPTLSEPFCHGCSRLRLTAWGTMRPCLFSSREVDLRPLLAPEADDSQLKAAFYQAVAKKPARNPVLFEKENPEHLLIRSLGG